MANSTPPAFHDAEDVLCDLLEQAVNASPSDGGAGKLQPRPAFYTFLPTDYSSMLDTQPIVVVQRIGGVATQRGQVDNALIELGAVAKTRAQAWHVLGNLRAWIAADGYRNATTPARIVSLEEVQGPTTPVWINPDHRYVKTIVQLNLRKPRT